MLIEIIELLIICVGWNILFNRLFSSLIVADWTPWFVALLLVLVFRLADATFFICLIGLCVLMAFIQYGMFLLGDDNDDEDPTNYNEEY